MAFMLLASSQPTACAVFSSRGDQRVRVDPRRIDPAVTFGVYPFPDFIARRMRAELPFLYLVLEQLGSSRGASPGESVEHVVGVSGLVSNGVDHKVVIGRYGFWL